MFPAFLSGVKASNRVFDGTFLPNTAGIGVADEDTSASTEVRRRPFLKRQRFVGIRKGCQAGLKWSV